MRNRARSLVLTCSRIIHHSVEKYSGIRQSISCYVESAIHAHADSFLDSKTTALRYTAPPRESLLGKEQVDRDRRCKCHPDQRAAVNTDKAFAGATESAKKSSRRVTALNRAQAKRDKGIRSRPSAHSGQTDKLADEFYRRHELTVCPCVSQSQWAQSRERLMKKLVERLRVTREALFTKLRSQKK